MIKKGSQVLDNLCPEAIIFSVRQHIKTAGLFLSTAAQFQAGRPPIGKADNVPHHSNSQFCNCLHLPVREQTHNPTGKITTHWQISTTTE